MGSIHVTTTVMHVTYAAATVLRIARGSPRQRNSQA